jgi:hypothetical protein
MKINRPSQIAVLLSLVLFWCGINASSVIIPNPGYPKYTLNPSNPSMNDSVFFTITVGQWGSSCPPGFRTSFTVVQTSNNVCVRAPCPQDYVIKVSYTQLPPNPNLVCLAVMMDYGPHFAFGKLAVGNYTVMDSTKGNAAIYKFTVSENARVRGVVSENTDPLDLFKPVANCTVYYSGNGTADSTVTDAHGAFSISDALYSDVYFVFIAKGYFELHLKAKVPPDTLINVKLVRYDAQIKVSGTVYAATPPGVIGCAPSPVGCVVGTVPGCTVEVSQIAPVYLFQYKTITDEQGKFSFDSVSIQENSELTVISAYKKGFVKAQITDTSHPGYNLTANFALKLSTAVATPLERAGSARILSYQASSRTLRLVIAKPQQVSLSAYILNSRKVEQLSRKRFLAAGTYTIGLKNPKLSGGVIIFRVEGEDFSESLKINLTK